MRHARRPATLVALAVLTAAAALAALPGCSGGDGDDPGATATPAAATATATPTPTPTPAPTAPPTPVPPTAAATAGASPTAAEAPAGSGPLLPPELTGLVVQLLLRAMGDPDSELFSGSIAALPPEVRLLLDGLGADLLLGAVLADVGDGGAVLAVFPGSPAERAGLNEGDQLLAIGDAPYGSAAGLRAAIEAVEPGAGFALTVGRDGAERTLEVEREAEDAGNAWRAELLRSVALVLLMQGAPGGPELGPSLLGEFTEETADGLRVIAVFPDSPAEAGDLRPGDLLVSIAGRPIATHADLDALMRSVAPSAEPIEVVIVRDGEELTLAIDLAADGMLGGGAATQ